MKNGLLVNGSCSLTKDNNIIVDRNMNTDNYQTHQLFMVSVLLSIGQVCFPLHSAINTTLLLWNYLKLISKKYLSTYINISKYKRLLYTRLHVNCNALVALIVIKVVSVWGSFDILNVFC